MCGRRRLVVVVVVVGGGDPVVQVAVVTRPPLAGRSNCFAVACFACNDDWWGDTCMAYNENMTAAVDPASLAAYYSIRRCPWFRSSSTVRRSTTIDSYSPTSTRDDHRVCSLNLRSHTRSNAEPVRHAKQARRLQQPNTCWPNEERTDTPGIIKHAQTHSF